MRRLALGMPATGMPQDVAQWAIQALQEIERASYEGVEEVVNAYAVSNFTPTRSLNAGTATTTDIANLLCTLIDDIQKRGRLEPT